MRLAQLAFFVAIQSSIFFSSTVIGSEPVISTWAWNCLMSNLLPSASWAFFLRRWMVNAPIL